MNRKIQNAFLCIATFLALLLVSELLLRAFSVDIRIFLNDIGRKNRVATRHDDFIAAARNAGVTKDTFNIYFLGCSTMWGVPYGPYFSIPHVIDYRLDGDLGGGPVRTVNFGVAAKDIDYVRHVLELVMREKETFHPSLIVVYSGNNEFLKFHPTEPDSPHTSIMWLAHHSELARQVLTLAFRKKGEILETNNRTFFDRSIFPFDPRGKEKTMNNYKRNVFQIAELTEKNAVPLLISTTAGNHADWEPNRSILCRSAEGKKEEFLQTFKRGLKAEMRKDYAAALKAYQENLAVCDQFAEVNFRLGKVYRALNQFNHAKAAFQKAVDQDGMPIRAVSSQNDFIRSLDSLDHVFVVDSLAYLQNHYGLVGDNVIVDGVHPNFEGYLILGELIGNKILTFLPQIKELKPLLPEEAKEIFHVDQWKMFEVYYETGRWITRLATWRYDPVPRLQVAERFFQQAVEINPKGYEGFVGLGIISLLRGNKPVADGFLQNASAIDRQSVDQYLANPWVRKIVRRNHGLLARRAHSIGIAF